MQTTTLSNNSSGRVKSAVDPVVLVERVLGDALRMSELVIAGKGELG